MPPILLLLSACNNDPKSADIKEQCEEEMVDFSTPSTRAYAPVTTYDFYSSDVSKLSEDGVKQQLARTNRHMRVQGIPYGVYLPNTSDAYQAIKDSDDDHYALYISSNDDAVKLYRKYNNPETLNIWLTNNPIDEDGKSQPGYAYYDANTTVINKEIGYTLETTWGHETVGHLIQGIRHPNKDTFTDTTDASEYYSQTHGCRVPLNVSDSDSVSSKGSATPPVNMMNYNEDDFTVCEGLSEQQLQYGACYTIYNESIAAILVEEEDIEQVYTVCADGSGDYDTIQDAVEASQDDNPYGVNKIEICEGTYKENVIVGNENYLGLTKFETTNGPVIIDGDKQGPVLDLEGAHVEMNGDFTLQNGVGGIVMNYFSNTDEWTLNESYLKLNGVTISNNNADGTADGITSGGGISGSWLSFIYLEDDVTIANNSASDNGGAIALDNTEIHVTGAVTIENNTANHGGGIYLDTAAIIVDPVGKLEISNNTATQGGGLYADDPAGEITNTTFEANNATMGGAMYLVNVSNDEWHTLEVNNTGIADNTASNGAAIATSSNVTLTLEECTLDSNTESSNGVIYVQGGTTLSFEQSEFTNNSAVNGWGDDEAGLVYLKSEGVENAVSFTDSSFSGNEDCDVYNPNLSECTNFGTSSVTATCSTNSSCSTE